MPETDVAQLSAIAQGDVAGLGDAVMADAVPDAVDLGSGGIGLLPRHEGLGRGAPADAAMGPHVVVVGDAPSRTHGCEHRQGPRSGADVVLTGTRRSEGLPSG